MRIIIEHDLKIPMRDGVLLSADLYLPEDVSGPVPVLIRRTPYGKSGNPGGASLDGLRMARAGYALLVQDVRGRFSSGGTFEPYLNEAADGADTVAWAAAQPWCDGSAGLFGRSYEGMSALLAAMEGPPALGAVAPHVSGSGFDEGWTYQGGAFQLGFVLYWVLYDLLLTGAGLDSAAEREVAEAVDRIDALYRDPGQAAELLDRLAPYYKEWLAHPSGDAYWRRSAPRESYAAIKVPVLNITGWYDIFLAGALENSAAIPGTELVVGPWSHCVTGGVFPQRRYGLAADEQHLDVTGLHLAHFDRHLRQRPPPARAPRYGSSSPAPTSGAPSPPGRSPAPARTPSTSAAAPSPKPRACRAATSCATTRPTRSPPPAGPRRCPASSPAATAARSTSGRWSSGPTCCAGPRSRSTPRSPRSARPNSSCTSPRTPCGADVTGKLVDVHPGGRAEILTDGIRRLAGDAPGPGGGAVAEVRVRLGAIGHVFEAGHRIRLEIAGSNAPRFDTHPKVVAHHTVHHGGDHPSRLLLPLLTDD